MKLLVTGAGGLLASALAGRAVARGYEVVAMTRTQLDVRDGHALRGAVRTHRPDWLAQCAAYTAVDRAERESELAFRLNAEAAALAAVAARAGDASILYPSSDFVFDGSADRPYAPDDPPAPLSVYGRSKALGEEAVIASGARHLIVRTSWLYGAGGRNFVDSIVERSRRGETLRVVADQVSRPTWTGSLAEALLDLMAAGEEGLTHVADRGQASWYDLAAAALARGHPTGRLEAVSSDDWGAPAKRPAYSVLDLSDAERRLGRSLPHWRMSLGRHFTRAGRVAVGGAGT